MKIFTNILHCLFSAATVIGLYVLTLGSVSGKPAINYQLKMLNRDISEEMNTQSSEGIDITNLLSFEEFENIKKFVLNQGQTMTYCNMYNNNPYYKFGSIELFLNPIVQIPDPSSVSDPDTYNAIVLKMWDPPQDYQFLYTDITANKKTGKIYLSPYGEETKESMQLRYRTIGKYLTEIILEIQTK